MVVCTCLIGKLGGGSAVLADLRRQADLCLVEPANVDITYRG
jgi:hypothetical protein